jgi:hypothetical protein
VKGGGGEKTTLRFEHRKYEAITFLTKSFLYTKRDFVSKQLQLNKRLILYFLLIFLRIYPYLLPI